MKFKEESFFINKGNNLTCCQESSSLGSHVRMTSFSELDLLPAHLTRPLCETVLTLISFTDSAVVWQQFCTSIPEITEVPAGSSSLELFFDLDYAGDYKLIIYWTLVTLTWWKNWRQISATATSVLWYICVRLECNMKLHLSTCKMWTHGHLQPPEVVKGLKYAHLYHFAPVHHHSKSEIKQSRWIVDIQL